MAAAYGHGSLDKPLLSGAEEEAATTTNSSGSIVDNAGEILDCLGRPVPAGRRSRLGGSKTLIFTLATICLSYLGFFGVFFNIVVFFIDVLEAGSASAANNANYWLGTQFVFAIVGAFVAEGGLGRLWTSALFLVLNSLGMVLLTVAVMVIVGAGGGVSTSGAVNGFFYGGLYVVALGAGAFQPALQALGADQFETVAEKANFFTWYLVFDNVGMVLADTALVYITTNQGWVLGFWVSTAMVIGACLSFLVGLPFYRQLCRSAVNPYEQALKVLVSTVRKWKVKAPRDSSLLYENGDAHENGLARSNSSHRKLPHTSSWRLLDKAATVTGKEGGSSSSSSSSWELCTVTQVEEVKQVLRMLPVWGCNIVFYTVYAQGGTFFIEQGLVMDTHVGGSGGFRMESATMNLFNLAAVIFGPPIYDYAFVPLIRHYSGFSRGLTPLKRMGWGFLLSALSMAIAAALETARLRSLPPSSSASSLSIFWQVPQYFILGCAQFLGAVAQLEFFYMEAPESLRSLGSSFYGTAIALGNYLSSVLVLLVNAATSTSTTPGWIPRDLNQGHLDYFFWLLSGLTLLNLLVFCFCARTFQHANPDEYEPTHVNIQDSL